MQVEQLCRAALAFNHSPSLRQHIENMLAFDGFPRRSRIAI
jgi:hypothetical protein